MGITICCVGAMENRINKITLIGNCVLTNEKLLVDDAVIHTNILITIPLTEMFVLTVYMRSYASVDSDTCLKSVL